MQTCAILDDAGVPYTWNRVFGPPERTIATYAVRDHADIVVLDASHLGFFHREQPSTPPENADGKG
ncbi:hypothetical protein PTKU64_81100 [Paraburkholderia terrae]|uniref:Uncharacterized protein n=1 Tax=Paraburkholderia terrae TaxID=311230 RepID=A0ABM7U9I9_9BURK|nr:hypothetical protein PTKU64_81100 [Paraburkholderia terrae]BDC45686.1 hypothetical protein PTKU15_89830 [Paraburkholderia terrae]